MNYKKILSILLLLLCIFGSQKGEAATSDLTLTSGNKELTEGFAWAKEMALSYVATGRPGVPYPCYQGSYANDPQYCIRDISHQVEAGHLLGLRAENFSMLKRFADSGNKNTDPCRKHWPHWKFEFTGAGSNFTPELPTPFELAERAYEQYLWSGEDKWINDPVMAEFFKYTNVDLMNYLDDNGNGIIDIAKMKNQCNDGMASYWEFEHLLSNESGDAIGSQYQSLLGYSKILAANGDELRSLQYQYKAEQLRDKFEKTWYSQAENRYICGFLPNGQPLTGWGHEMSVFMLLKRITDMGPRTQNYIDFVHSNTYNQGINIETTTYYPEALYHHNANHLGWHWLLYDLRSRDIYPEVSFLAVRNSICGLMGVSADAPNHKIITVSRLVNDIPWVEANHISIGTNDLKVRHDGLTGSAVTNNSGPAITWVAQFYGHYTTLNVNGVNKPASQKIINGAEVSYVEVLLNPAESATVTVPQQPVADFVYLSDMTWKSVSNAELVRKDICVTGYAMTLKEFGTTNKTFSKGIGMKNSQEVTYNLEGKYHLFIANIGLDIARLSKDGQSGPVTYRVIADGQEIYNSGPMTKESDTKSIALDVAGKQELKLITDTAPYGNSYADWGNARLSSKAAPFFKLSYLGIENDNNRDALPDPGETLDLKLSINNMGSVASGENTKITCEVLGTNGSLVKINTKEITLGQLIAKGNTDRLFNITIDPTTPKQTRFEFKFTITDGTTTEVITQSLITPYPIMNMEYSRIVNRPTAVSSENLLNPGDAAEIEIILNNTGNSPSGTMKVTCNATGDNNAFLTIPVKTFTIAPVAPGAKQALKVAFSLSSSITANKNVTFSFSLFEENGVNPINNLDRRFTTPSADYYVEYKVLNNLSNNLGMIDAGQTSEIVLNITNKGNKKGSRSNLTVAKTEGNIHLYNIGTQGIDLGEIAVNETVQKSIPISINANAPVDYEIALLFKVDDGNISSTLIKRWAIGAVYCSDMPWAAEYAGYNKANRDFKIMSNSMVQLNGKSYSKGIGTHALSRIDIDLNGKFKQFISDAGIDGAITAGGSCEFQVYIDNVLKWNSGVLHAGGASASCNIDVTGGQKMQLVVTEGNDGINSDHGDWAGARLIPSAPTATDNITESNKISIYPTMVKNSEPITIRFQQEKEGEIQLILFNTAGTIINQTKHNVSSGDNQIKLDTGKLRQGMYILSIFDAEGKMHTEKISIM